MPSDGERSGIGGEVPGLIVFDLDGTLVDSRADLTTAVNKTLQSFDRTALSEEAVAGFIGDGAAMLVSRVLAATGSCNDALLAQALPVFFDRYRFHETDRSFVYPGVFEALAAIRAQFADARLAVLTNKPVAPSLRICEKLGLSVFLHANYGGDSFASKKPDPAGLLHLSRQFSTPAAQTVMVGDSDVDVETARAAGARSIGCTWGYQRAAMLAADPDGVANHPRDWPGLLLAMRERAAAFA